MFNVWISLKPGTPPPNKKKAIRRLFLHFVAKRIQQLSCVGNIVFQIFIQFSMKVCHENPQKVLEMVNFRHILNFWATDTVQKLAVPNEPISYIFILLSNWYPVEFAEIRTFCFCKDFLLSGCLLMRVSFLLSFSS